MGNIKQQKTYFFRITKKI